MSLAWNRRSEYATVATRVVVFISSMARSRKAGIIRLMAWGRTMRRISWPYVLPIARAASHWPRSTDTMPPRKTSAKNAEDCRANVITAAWKESMRTPMRIGSAERACVLTMRLALARSLPRDVSDDPDAGAQRVPGQVGQRKVLHLDHVDGRAVRAGRDRLVCGELAGGPGRPLPRERFGEVG